MSGEFHWLDYVLFVATLALSAAIGIWAAFSGGGQNTTAKYLMGNRNLAFFPVSHWFNTNLTSTCSQL